MIETDVAPGAKVVVAMSGGVDSSVAAALYARAGCEVVGVTLQLYDHGAAAGRPGSCCAGRDIEDARRVADQLGIAHYVLDFEERFRRAVIDDFADGYAAGRTPVPCVRCNERVKFGDLLDIAGDLGAAALVTGHYARRVDRGGVIELRRAADPGKDQSYFLFATTAAQLAFARFPLGSLVKSATRRLAAELGLATAEKPDSQDICFVPRGHYSDLVGRLRPDALESGEIVDGDGRALGRHAGLARYTVGQRRGLGISAAEPLYVTELDAARRRIVVGPRRAGLVAAVELEGVNWLGDCTDAHVAVKHRANEPEVPARVELLPGDRAAVRFARAEAGVAPGQACVAYEGDRVLGGGWIARTSRERLGPSLDMRLAAS